MVDNAQPENTPEENNDRAGNVDHGHIVAQNNNQDNAPENFNEDIVEEENYGDVLDPEEHMPGVLYLEELLQAHIADVENGNIEPDPDEDLLRDAYADMEDMGDGIIAGNPLAEREPAFTPQQEMIDIIARSLTDENHRLIEGRNGNNVENLPAENLPHDRRQQNRLRDLGLRQIHEMPGYNYLGGRSQEAIRVLGRKIFSRLPCYSRLGEICRNQNLDPLGQIWMISNVHMLMGNAPITGGDQHISAVLNWLNENPDATLLDAATLHFNDMNGYSANCILYATEDDSYLIVQEPQRIGNQAAPCYIYSWKGGMQVYRLGNNAQMPLSRIQAPNPNGRTAIRVEMVHRDIANENLGRLRAIGRNQQALPAPQIEMIEQDQVPQAAENHQRQEPVQPQIDENRGPRSNNNKEGHNAKPVNNEPNNTTRKAPKNIIQILRAEGFSTYGSDTGPALRKAIPDGGYVVVTGHGKSLALATEFDVHIFDQNENKIKQFTSGAAQEILNIEKNDIDNNPSDDSGGMKP